MAFVQNAQEKAKNVGYNCINPTPHTKILHPILHPKSSVNTGHLAPWCRKCRRISKTFFVEGGRKNAMQRSGKCKTSDFFGQKYGCFASKVRMFSSKKSDVFVFRKGYSALTLDFILRFCRSAKSKQVWPLLSLLYRFALCARLAKRWSDSRFWHIRCRPVHLCPWLSDFQPSQR